MNSLRISSRGFRAPRNASLPATLSHVRHFHPTKPAPSLINVALDASTGLIHGVHNVTHLPWVASIPLTAVLVRTAIGFPLQFFTRIHARRERDIAPLLLSAQMKFTKEGKKKGESAPEVMKKVHAWTAQTRKQWGVHSWYKFLTFAQLPVWISLMESIRGMCGSTNGLVPWLLSLIEPTQEGAAEAVKSLHLTVEPTLANEGALWFPDLLAGDPTGALPALLTASILLNVNLGWKQTSMLEMSDMPKLQMYQSFLFTGMRVFIQVLAVNVGLSGWYHEMPTALMIYWITSTNVATIQTWFLDKFLFSRPPIPAYKTKHIKLSQAGDPFRLKLRS
ncbi:hypothetical protein N7520_007348 [Penicillium odoratum]|uniref:uncharacterized protein n=1 Tax=Penicillium odoratum TaxID=1167516 RepID=UPI002548C5CC|nr:uncharacterized protein N7520_007348 [Penicillium odoratum]KAJ5760192.1 hypothetical protein N7520_007348 [Penicillium odoratum]